MMLVDTSVWIDLLRDASRRKAFDAATRDQDIVLTRFQQLELLQGCRDEREWLMLTEYLDVQEYLEMTPESWPAAARVYYVLRRRGVPVRSPIACCIAQLAIEHSAVLIHRDEDFERIAELGALKQIFLKWDDEDR